MNSNNESEVINFFSRFLSSIFFVERIQSHKQKRFDKNNVRSWPKKKKKQRQHLKLQPLFFVTVKLP